jgi:hypothetical protein
VRKIKFYLATAAFVPLEWLRAVEERGHIRQGDLRVFAPTKVEAERMLEERRRYAGGMVKELRYMSTPPYPRLERLLIEAGLINPEESGVYVAPLSSRKGRKVARIEQDGTPTIIGVLQFDTSHGAERREWVEAV